MNKFLFRKPPFHEIDRLEHPLDVGFEVADGWIYPVQRRSWANIPIFITQDQRHAGEGAPPILFYKLSPHFLEANLEFGPTLFS